MKNTCKKHTSVGLFTFNNNLISAILQYHQQNCLHLNFLMHFSVLLNTSVDILLYAPCFSVKNILLHYMVLRALYKVLTSLK